MKTLILNANSDIKINSIILQRLKKISKGLPNRFVFDFLKKAPLSIQGTQDGALAKNELIKYFNKKNNRGYGSYILCCFDDLALDEIQSIVKKPVFSLCKSSLTFASLLIGKTCILTISKKSVVVIKQLLKKYNAKNIKVYSLNTNIINMHSSNFNNILKKRIAQIIKKNNVKNIILGSTGLTQFKNSLQKKFPINIIDGLECSLYLAGIKTQ